MPEHPPERAMAGLWDTRGRRDCQYWALGIGEAVAAHPAGKDMGQRATAAGPDDKQIARAAGDEGEDGAWGAALDHGPDRQIGGDLPPCGVKRMPQPLPGIVGPEVAQGFGGAAPVGEIAIRWHPGMHGYQGGVADAGKMLRLAQCTEVAR